MLVSSPRERLCVAKVGIARLGRGHRVQLAPSVSRAQRGVVASLAGERNPRIGRRVPEARGSRGSACRALGHPGPHPALPSL